MSHAFCVSSATAWKTLLLFPKETEHWAGIRRSSRASQPSISSGLAAAAAWQRRQQPRDKHWKGLSNLFWFFLSSFGRCSKKVNISHNVISDCKKLTKIPVYKVFAKPGKGFLVAVIWNEIRKLSKKRFRECFLWSRFGLLLLVDR